jgi:hypothetical protein
MANGKIIVPDDAIEVPDDAVEVGEKIPEPQAKQSMAETALHGFGKGASFGLTDEARGLMAGVGEASQLMREGVGLEVPSSQRPALERIKGAYVDERDSARKDFKQGEKDNPKTMTWSEILGAVMMPSPVKGGIAKQGLAAGALGGFGNSEAADAGDLLVDTAIGGGTGLATGKVLQGGGNALKRMANTRALRAAGAMKPDFSMLAKASPSGNRSAEAQRLGRKLLDSTTDDGSKILGWLDTPEKLAPKLAEATEDTGRKIGGHVDVMQDLISKTETPRASFPPLPAGAPEFAPVLGRPVSMVEIGKKLLAESEEMALQPGKAQYADSLRKEAETILRQAEDRAASGGYASLTLPETEAAKRGLANTISPMDWLSSTTKPGAEAKKQASRAFRRASEDTIESMVGPDERTVFEALKGRYGDMRTLRDIAQRGEIADAARMPLGLTEQNAMLGALGTGGLPIEQLAKAGGAGLLSRLTRGRGDAFAARALDAASEVPSEAAMRATTQTLTPEEDTRQRILEYLKGMGK